MAGTYNTEGKTQKLARAYGVHAIHSGNGKLIEHEATRDISGVSVKARLALGEASFHEIEKLYYDGIEVPSDYQLFKNSGATNPASTMFPTRDLSGAASFVDYLLPAGMNVDNQPDKALLKAKCLEIADYNSGGGQIDFGFSQNPGRIIADAVKHITGDVNFLEFSSFVEYRDWTGENIPVTIDGAVQYLPRFSTNFWLIPPYNLKTFLDRICQVTCSDWTWANGKIRLIAALDRAPAMALTKTHVAKFFKFQSTQADQRPNGIRVLWRNELHPFLIAEDPIIIDRRENENEDENFTEINVGVCRRDVAERIANFWAKVLCDLPDFAFLRATRRAYVLLPGDIVEITHPTPDWTAKRCKIIKKTEKEDRTTPEGPEKFEGYGLFVQVEPENPYSDTDFEPLQTRTPVVGPNPYAAPPSATLSVQQDSQINSDGTRAQTILGQVTFNPFHRNQKGIIYWMKAGEPYEFLTEVLPSANNTAIFRTPPVGSGDNWFKVVTENVEFLTANTNVSTQNEKKVTVDATKFIVGGFIVDGGLFRSYTSTATDGSYTGRDSAVVPREVIKPWVDSATVIADNISVVLAVKFASLGSDTEGKPIHNQTDSVYDMQVEVFNQFGVKVKNFPPSGINRGGGTVATTFPRKNADVFEGQAYFKISILNRINQPSLPVYLRYNRASDSPTPAYVISNTVLPQFGTEIGTVIETPRNVVVTALDFQTLQIRYINYTTVNIYYREFGKKEWQLHTVQWTGATAINKFPAEKLLEIQLRDYVSGDRSEIVTVQLPPQPAAPPEKPVPTLTVNVDAANPTSKIFYSVQKNTTANTGIDYQVSSTPPDDNSTVSHAGANDVSGEIPSLPEGATRFVRARNVFSGGATSAWSGSQSATTQITPPTAVEPPGISGANYDVENTQSVIQFAPNTGATGTFLLQFREGSSGSFATAVANIPATDTLVYHPLLQSRYTKYYEYRIGRTNGQGGWSQPIGVEVQLKDDYVKPPDYDPFEPNLPIL